MSGAFLSGLGAAGYAPAWVAKLQLASFRGVPFNVEGHEENGGRRAIQFDLPGRDTPSGEDMGRKGGVYRVRAFVLGDDYLEQRDALRNAVQEDGTIGALIHPYLGTLFVRPSLMRMREQLDPAGIAQFDLEFFEDGKQPVAASSTDTASSLLGGIKTALTVISQAYGYAMLIKDDPAALGALAGIALGSFGSAFLGGISLPTSMLSLLSPSAAGISTSPEDTAATAASVTTLTQTTAALVIAQDQATTPDQAQAVAAAAVANISSQASSTATIDGLPSSLAATPTPDAAAIAAAIANAQSIATGSVDDPVAGVAPTTSAPTDPSFGLLTLAQWIPPSIASSVSAGTVPATVLLPQLASDAAAVQAAVQALLQGACLCAVAQIYASIDWPDAQAATAAGEQLLDLIDAQIDAASAAAQDDLTMAWRGMAMLVANDSYQRAQALPQLTDYQLGAPLPAFVLAQRFYRDGSRADELAQLNGAWHAAWMPPAGVALAA